MVPEKGRNTGVALEAELTDEPYDVEWLQSLINGKGKEAAKTGVGYDELSEQVDNIRAMSHGGEDGALLLEMKPLGRLKPRPVFEELELGRKRLESYESPQDAWQERADRFYVGLDELLEELLAGDDLPIERGFEAIARAELADRGYELTRTIGDEVKWAVMAADSVPDQPETVLVPATFERLGRALARRYWDESVHVVTFERYAQTRDRVDADEEALLADAPSTVAGIYMYVTGTTARQHGLAIDPVAGAVSELAVFERETDGDMTQITSLKGFYDRYGDEFAAWREVIDTVERTATEFGFREINTPAVERRELYEVKSGDELLEQTYSFTDKNGRNVTLTPEQTPTRARMVQERKDLGRPIKWVDTSKRWRYENVQKGRDREFFQTDIDVFGVESVAADAEIIACAATIYRRLGVESQVEFLINDRQLLESVLEANGVTNTVEVMRVVDDKEKLSRTEFFDALDKRGLDRETAERVDRLTEISGPITETIDELRAESPDDEDAIAAIDRMEALAEELDSHDVASMCKLDLSIVRGLAYYTGLVFEAFDTEGELRALFGGGRYDDLVGLFGEQDVPAVGFAFGYSTTRELLVREGEWPAEAAATDVFVANVSESVRDTALEIARGLRADHHTVETDLSGRGLGDQFAYADRINADFVLIVGERDLSDGVVTLRDMESGDEETVDLDRVTDELDDRLD